MRRREFLCALVASSRGVSIGDEAAAGRARGRFRRRARLTSSATSTVPEVAVDPEREWVDFENAGDAARELTGWAGEDEAGHRYVLPDGFELGAGDTVRLHSGNGTDTATDLYGGSDYTWNDGGDTCYLYDGTGGPVDTYSY